MKTPEYKIRGRKKLDEWEDVDVGSLHDLPLHWQFLSWWRVEQVPCMCGDDLFIAIDRESGTSYLIFDEWCGDWYPYDPDLSTEELVMKVAQYGDECDELQSR